MDRETALKYVGYAVDDVLSVRRLDEIPPNARLVGWQCGFEPMFVAVWSYLPGIVLDAGDAEDIATDYLEEIEWFAPLDNPGVERRRADYILFERRRADYIL